jgi:hypothetical protein
VSGSHAAVEARDLPVWPLWVLFAGFPVLWLLGLAGFAPQLAAIPMFATLATTRRVRLPRGFGIWILFLIWTLASAVEVDGGSRLLGFAFRASEYLSAAVIFVYVYNSSRRALPLRKLAVIMTWLLASVVVGGYLGLIAPYHVLDTPLARVMPQSLLNNSLVGNLIKPPFAETLNSQYVHLAPRPAAPFPYTNDWGVNFALLVPFVMALVLSTTKLRVRGLLVGLLVLGAIPALLTLNRGMLLGLAVGAVYVAIRFALRGHLRGLIAVGLGGLVALGLVAGLHINQRIANRTDTSDTNQTRTSLYVATFDATRQSPLLGYGSPRPSTVEVGAPSLGSQGQLWMVMYSSGFPGLLFFVGGLGFLIVRTRRTQDPASMWVHAATVMALSMIPFYRLESLELAIVMAAAAIVMRDAPAAVVMRQRSQPTLAALSVPVSS